MAVKKPARLRKRKELNNLRDEIREMAKYQSNPKDIAQVLGITKTEIVSQFKQEFRGGRAEGRLEMEKKSYELAKSGKFPNVTLSFLKTFCGWSNVLDKPTGFGLVRKRPSLKPISSLTTDPVEAAKIYQQIMGGD